MVRERCVEVADVAGANVDRRLERKSLISPSSNHAPRDTSRRVPQSLQKKFVKPVSLPHYLPLDYVLEPCSRRCEIPVGN
jgi:hypothetical protein